MRIEDLIHQVDEDARMAKEEMKENVNRVQEQLEALENTKMLPPMTMLDDSAQPSERY